MANWRAWLKLERLIPGATILLAFVAQPLQLFGVINLSLGERILLLLIGLLGVDALTERLTVLENIRSDIRKIGKNQISLNDLFHFRARLPPLEELLANAKSIDISGMSLLSISTEHRELLLDKVRKGCRIRLLLPNSKDEDLMRKIAPFVGTLSAEIHTQAIITSLDSLTSLPALFNSDLMQIRICDYPPAHGLFIINGNTPEGNVRVELYVYKRVPRNTPGFYIRKSQDLNWFEIFWTEFEDLWANATPYKVDTQATVSN
jgi:hypothetical protein